MLRSRLLGKVLLPPFPSPLPANTILDCILDERWKSTGILHVLDVIRWKGQDVAGCEAGFRSVHRSLLIITSFINLISHAITDFYPHCVVGVFACAVSGGAIHAFPSCLPGPSQGTLVPLQRATQATFSPTLLRS